MPETNEQWDELIAELEKAPKLQALIQYLSAGYIKGDLVATETLECIGILAGDV